MVEVYRNIISDFFHVPDECKLRHLIKVAEVNTDDLDVAFRLTNSIDEHWTDNDDIDFIHPRSAPKYSDDDYEIDTIHYLRSTSVGDVMRHNGVWSVVDRFGFKEIKIIE